MTPIDKHMQKDKEAEEIVWSKLNVLIQTKFYIMKKPKTSRKYICTIQIHKNRTCNIHIFVCWINMLVLVSKTEIISL